MHTTVCAPSGEPVPVLHGTAGSSGTRMLLPPCAGELFGPGQPLDATRHFIILPDANGAGKSSKPSDGPHAKFPHYNVDDMVLARYRWVTQALGLDQLRLLRGNSTGGMHTWIWGGRCPRFMDALVPMASQPTERAGRNWMKPRMLTDSIRHDPDWNEGNYTTQPRALRFANVLCGITTTGGSLAAYNAGPTRALADKRVEERMSAAFAADANDLLYQWEASSGDNASPGLERLQAALLAFNSADDERNPQERGIIACELQSVKGSRLLLIPANEETPGPRHHRHGEIPDACGARAVADGAGGGAMKRGAAPFRMRAPLTHLPRPRAGPNNPRN